MTRARVPSFAAHENIVCPPFRSKYFYGDEQFVVRLVRDYKDTPDGPRWLVAWEGAKSDGKAWDDSWEPTSFVSKSLRDAFHAEKTSRVSRLLPVDTRALDTLVQRSVGQAVMAARDNIFGEVHDIPIGTLLLRDLAVHFGEVMIEDYGAIKREHHRLADQRRLTRRWWRGEQRGSGRTDRLATASCRVQRVQPLTQPAHIAHVLEVGITCDLDRHALL